MILLDTHVWIWYVDQSGRLAERHLQAIEEHRSIGIGISAISCWEVAKLVEHRRLKLACSISSWMESALAQEEVRVLELSPRIAVESTMLPGPFHRDPADQIIVATARVHDLVLLTEDEKLTGYPHVRTL
jgi:PIN domain nuclease of toxin-antitoxin system